MHNHRLARPKEVTFPHPHTPTFRSGSARNTAVGVGVGVGGDNGVSVDALLASVLGLGKKLCPVQSGKRAQTG